MDEASCVPLAKNLQQQRKPNSEQCLDACRCNEHNCKIIFRTELPGMVHIFMLY